MAFEFKISFTKTNRNNIYQLSVCVPYKGFWTMQIMDIDGFIHHILLSNQLVDIGTQKFIIKSLDLDNELYLLLIKDESTYTYWIEKLIITKSVLPLPFIMI